MKNTCDCLNFMERPDPKENLNKYLIRIHGYLELFNDHTFQGEGTETPPFVLQQSHEHDLQCPEV